MNKISVLVEVDLDGQYVRVNVTGALTALNQQGLHPVLRRARTMLPGATVTVDLTCVRELEPVAVDLLHRAVEHEDGLRGAVELLLPRKVPAEAAVSALDARRRMRAEVLRRRYPGRSVPLPERKLVTAS